MDSGHFRLISRQPLSLPDNGKRLNSARRSLGITRLARVNIYRQSQLYGKRIMAKTEDQKRDAYYLKKYGVGLDWYNARFKEQGGCCGICHRPQELFNKRFAVDHDHHLVRLKIWTRKLGPRWWKAGANEGHWVFWACEETKPHAIRQVKSEMRAASCRGLLCPWCNRGLRFYADDPTRLANAAEYLKRHQNAR